MPTGSTAVQRGRPDDGLGAAQAEILRDPGRIPEPGAYVARGEARAAYPRACAAQLATNTGKPLIA
jgi:hypothetical protein